MGKKSSLNKCKSHDDLVGYAAGRGARIVEGGRHTKVYGPEGGMAPIPRHRGDLATGTRCAIIRAFKLMGLAVLALAFAYANGLLPF